VPVTAQQQGSNGLGNPPGITESFKSCGRWRSLRCHPGREELKARPTDVVLNSSLKWVRIVSQKVCLIVG